MPLATLSIDLEARIAKFEQGLDKAAREAEKNAERTRAAWARAGSTITGIAGTIAGAFAGYSITQFVQANVDALDALNDTADATGASIENISALEDVARRTGTTLDTVSGILVKFNGVLADAKPGSPQADALKAIGLNAAELKSLDPAEALRRTAVALASYADDGNKARLVQDLFGKSVREAAPFLKDLAEQGKLNATVTTEQAEAAEKFNKQMFEFKTNISNAARSLVAELIPAINQYFEAIKQSGGVGNVILSNAGLDALSFKRKELERLQLQIDSEASKAGQLNEALGKDSRAGLPVNRAVDQAYQASRARLQSLQSQAQKASAELKALADEANPIAPPNYFNDRRTSPEIKGVIADTSTAPKKAELFGPDLPPNIERALKLITETDAAKVRDLSEQLLALINLRASGRGGDDVDQAIAKVRKELGDLSPAAKKAAEEQQRLNELLAATPTAELEKARADMQRLAEAFEAGTITVEQFNEAATARLGNLPPEIKKAADDMDEFAKQGARNIQDSLGGSIKAALKGDFDSILDIWADTLAEMAAQALAAQVGKYVLGDFGKTGNLGGLAGQAGGFLDDLMSLWGGSTYWAKGGAFGASGPVSYFAKGDVFGSPTAFSYGGGKLGVLGEAGEEGVLPLKRGPDGRLGVIASGGGGRGTVNNFSFSFPIQAGVSRAEVAQLIPVITEQVKAGVAMSMQRPGSRYR